MVAFVVYARRFVPHGTGSHINFNAQNRFYAGGFRFFIKFHGSVHVAVVGERQSWHPKAQSFTNQFVYFCQSVQKAVVAMRMEMHKAHCG